MRGRFLRRIALPLTFFTVIGCSKFSLPETGRAPIAVEFELGRERADGGLLDAPRNIYEKKVRDYFSNHINSTFRTDNPQVLKALDNRYLFEFSPGEGSNIDLSPDSGTVRIKVGSAEKLRPSLEALNGALLIDIWNSYHTPENKARFSGYSAKLKRMQLTFEKLKLSTGTDGRTGKKYLVYKGGLVYDDGLTAAERRDLTKFFEWNPHGKSASLSIDGVYGSIGMKGIPELLEGFYDGVLGENQLKNSVDSDIPLRTEGDFGRIEKLLEKAVRRIAENRSSRQLQA